MIALLKALVASPKAAALIMAALYGRPDLADDLIDICHRESRCSSSGKHSEHAHARDAWISPKEWEGQRSWGHLDPKCQPKNFPGGWATRGAFGLSAGAHWKYMWRCYDPDWFDVPLVSAWVAVRKYKLRCVNRKRRARRGWCAVSRASWRNNETR